MLLIEDQQLNVIDRGSGIPVLLIHGFPLQAAMWDYQVDALVGAGWRVVAVDLPGFGGSPTPADPTSCSMDGYADLIAGVIDQLDLGQVVLGGISMGGYIAFAFVRRHADRLRAIVLADTRAQADDGNTWQDRTDQQRLLRDGEPISTIAKPLVEKLLGRPALRHQDLVDYVSALMTGNTEDGLIGALEAMKHRPDSMLTLNQVTVPTLVLVGSQDRVTPLIEANLIRSKIGELAELVTVPEAGHLSNLENPLDFNELLLDFLHRLDGAPERPAPAPDDVEVDATDPATTSD
ncbi:MAG: alpha/beta fold hydrolase [Acidimicrobiales bacterium]